MYVCVSVSVSASVSESVCVCVCVCMCVSGRVCERERQRERERVAARSLFLQAEAMICSPRTLPHLFCKGALFFFRKENPFAKET